MSLFSTIAHRGAAKTRGFSLKDVGMSAIGLVVGVAIGLAVATDHQTIDGSATAQVDRIGLSHDEFVRLNTTDLEYLSPTAPATSGALHSDRVEERFWEWNVTSLEYQSVPEAERRTGPR